MISPEIALKLILKNTPKLDNEFIDILEARGRTLARDIYSDMDIPPFNKSAMDGFACRSNDLKKANVILDIIEDIPAGFFSKKIIKNGQCARIMTGACLPKAADTVVRVEDTKFIDKFRVKILKTAKKNENLCQKAEDIKKNQLVLTKGIILRPQEIGILASCGIKKVPVIKKPKIAIISTGDELVDVTQIPKNGQIRDSNSYSLFSQVEKLGILAKKFSIVKDKPNAIKKIIKKTLKYNIVLISGGVSVGKYDYTKDVLKKMHVKFIFEKIAIRPGMPTAFGIKNKTLIFGLAGNPVSTFVIFEVFVKPAIYKLMNYKFSEKEILAKLEIDVKKKSGRTHYLPADFKVMRNNFWVRPVRFHGSADLFSLTNANSLIIIPKNAYWVKKGSFIKVVLLN